MKRCLRSKERQAIRAFLDSLQQHHSDRVLQTILFGSKARGDGTSWSDIDILVVVDHDDWRLSHAISTLAADASLEFNVLISPRVVGKERWERMRERRFGLYRNIAAEGIPLTPAST